MSETQISIAKSIDKQAENGRQFVEISKQHRDRTDQMAKQLDDVHQVIVRKKDAKD
jgi:predicted transcriptional regulator